MVDGKCVGHLLDCEQVPRILHSTAAILFGVLTVHLLRGFFRIVGGLTPCIYNDSGEVVG